jgi:hypothetical protein
LNGVTNAVNEPRKFVLAAMDFLRTRALVFLAFLPSIRAIHIGSGGPAKGRAIGPSRDFAAVVAQTPEPAARNRYFARIFNQLDLIPSDRNDSP